MMIVRRCLMAASCVTTMCLPISAVSRLWTIDLRYVTTGDSLHMSTDGIPPNGKQSSAVYQGLSSVF